MAALLLASVGRAAVIPIAPSEFTNSSSITFGGLPNNTQANGLVVGGVTFVVTLNGATANGLVTVDGGPGMTNNINPPNLVSTIAASQPTLTVILPGFSTQFGYGFALLAEGTVANATMIELFNGATSVGSLAYMATPDPSFPGGFAGIESTLPFDRAELTFSPTAISFAVDNFVFNSPGVAENGSTFEVLLVAVVLLVGLRRYWIVLPS